MSFYTEEEEEEEKEEEEEEQKEEEEEEEEEETETEDLASANGVPPQCCLTTDATMIHEQLNNEYQVHLPSVLLSCS